MGDLNIQKISFIARAKMFQRQKSSDNIEQTYSPCEVSALISDPLTYHSLLSGVINQTPSDITITTVCANPSWTGGKVGRLTRKWPIKNLLNITCSWGDAAMDLSVRCAIRSFTCSCCYIYCAGASECLQLIFVAWPAHLFLTTVWEQSLIIWHTLLYRAIY